MGVPQVYRKSDERAIATFDFVDIASGLGNVIFFGIASTEGSTVSYHLLTESNVWSEPVGTTQTGNGTKEINFDTSTFNLPRTAKGTAYLSAGVGASGGQTTKITAQLIHVDSGATETTITDEIVSQVQPSTTGIVFLPLPITEKHFKKGEILRLEIKITHAGGVNNSDFGHDPQNQEFGNITPSAADTTVMRLIMPFKVDI